MKLERIDVFPVDFPLNAARCRTVETHIAAIAAPFGQTVDYKWLKRGEEKFLRITMGPAMFELVFFADRAELYGAAPPWARLLFTSARKAELKQRVQEALAGSGFIRPSALPAGDRAET